MFRLRRLAMLTVAGALAACTPAKAPPAEPVKAPSARSADVGDGLEAPWTLETTTLLPREGDLAAVTFKVRNASKNVILLRDVALPRDLMESGSASSAATWQYAQAGQLTYLPDREEWVYDRSKRAETRRPVFNSGMIVPGETIVVRTRIRLLEMPMDFQFSYFELPIEDVRRKVFFEERRDKETRFKLMLGRDLQDRLTKQERTDVQTHRTVIFPHAEPGGSTHGSLKTVRVQADLQPRPFSLSAACRRASIAPPRANEYTFCGALDAWVLPTDPDHALVTPAGTVPLPKLRQMERIFYLIDTVSPQKIQVELRGSSIATVLQEMKYPIVTSRKPSGEDYYVFLQPGDLPRFFADIKTLKLILGVSLGEAGGRLEVLNK